MRVRFSTLPRTALFLGAVCLCLALTVQARPVVPFYTFNQSPLIQIYGLPAIGDARILSAGDERYRLLADLASHYAKRDAPSESVLLDGESTRVAVAYTRSWGRGIEWGLEIPYVSHSGGVLDGFIERWHDVFGLPQGGRPSAQRDLLDYRYQRQGRELLTMSEENEGLGDVRLSAGWELLAPDEETDTALSLRGSLKLPTGDSSLLRGSGGTDLALWLDAGHGGYGLGPPASLYGGLGVLFMEKGDILPDQRRRSVLFGSVGAGAWLVPSLALKLQLDFHSPFYRDSTLAPLSANATQLSIGGDLRLVKHTRIELGVVEDLTVTASPDVVFHIGITVREN